MKETPTQLIYQFSILGSGMKAAVVTEEQQVERKDLDALLAKFDKAVGVGTGGGTAKDVTSFGEEFADLLLPKTAHAVLPEMKERHLVMVHDTESSRIPWETLTIKDWTAAVAGGLSRRYLVDHLPLATWMEERRINPTLNLLLVVNPTKDLPGAE